MRIHLFGQGNAGVSQNVDAQQLTGYFAEYDSYDDRTNRYLVPVPALKSVINLPISEGGVMGLHYCNNHLYAVTNAGNLWDVNLNTLAQTNRGALPNWTTPTTTVYMLDNGASNGHQLLIQGGNTAATPGNGKAWVYDLNSFAITAVQGTSNWPSSIRQMTQQDTLGIMIPDDNTCKFYLSNGFDFKTTNGSNVGQPQTITDSLISVISDNIRLYLFGATGLEVWYDSGDPTFTFTRIPGAIYPIGCGATNSVVKIDNSIIWLGVNEWGHPSVFQIRGENAPERISSAQVDWQLDVESGGEFGYTSDAWAFAYKERGHEFYVLNTGTGKTICYDVTTQEWHQRDDTLSNSAAWPAACHAFIPVNATSTFAGQHLFGNWINKSPFYYINGGYIFEATDAYSTGADSPIRYFISPHLNDQDKRLFVNAFQVIVNSGDKTGTVPVGTMTISWAKNNTFAFTSSSTFSTWTAASRARIRRLGWARDWLFQITCTGMSIPPVILDGVVDLLYRTEGAPQSAGS